MEKSFFLSKKLFGFLVGIAHTFRLTV